MARDENILPTPVLPYGRQTIGQDDIDAVVEVLRSDWLTTGPKVDEFEEAFADRVGTKHAAAVSNGTAALHGALAALEIGAGDEVIVPAMTFAATANAVVFQGARPVFSDVERESLLLDPAAAKEKITDRTRAIIAVDYAGQPCHYGELRELATSRGLALVADACHALGAQEGERSVGSLADLSTFSFHPVKHITTGEGGMVTTDDATFYQRVRRFRNHGLASDHRERTEAGSWFYEMVDLGYNYRLSDFQCALGLSQLRKLDHWLGRRREIASFYDSALASLGSVEPLSKRPGATHSYHLYIVRLSGENVRGRRQEVYHALRARGIGTNVHYIPVHLHPYYRRNFGTGPGLCPVAEKAYEEILSLPIFPAMSRRDCENVVEQLAGVVESLTG